MASLVSVARAGKTMQVWTWTPICRRRWRERIADWINLTITGFARTGGMQTPDGNDAT